MVFMDAVLLPGGDLSNAVALCRLIVVCASSRLTVGGLAVSCVVVAVVDGGICVVDVFLAMHWRTVAI